MEFEKTIAEKKHDEMWFDQSKRAEASLEKILEEETPDELIERELSQVSVDKARSNKRILGQDSGRVSSRVLFVTKDASYLEKESKAMKTMLRLSSLFDEVHIMVLLPITSKKETKRVSDNVWTYRVEAKSWWSLATVAIEKSNEQLSFTGGFRPDIVVALDPYESGFVALRLSRKFDRPFQIHISENFLEESFSEKEKGNSWRRTMAKHVLARSKSVRVSTGALKEIIENKFQKIDDLQTLPQFYNFNAFIEAKPSFDVHEKYKDFVFVILAFGPLTSDSHLHDTFSALNSILHNPRIGLVIIGDGPSKDLFEKKAELLGIKKNVVFVSSTTDLTSYLKTSDVLIQTDVSKGSEDIVLKAAASGLPVVMFETDTRKDLFEDSVSASLCEPGDIHGLSKNMTMFLNNQGLRIQYKTASLNMVETRLQEDEETYYRAFHDSIELAINDGNNTEINEKT